MSKIQCKKMKYSSFIRILHEPSSSRIFSFLNLHRANIICEYMIMIEFIYHIP